MAWCQMASSYYLKKNVDKDHVNWVIIDSYYRLSPVQPKAKPTPTYYQLDHLVQTKALLSIIRAP